MLPDVVATNGFSLDRLATLCAVVESGSISIAAGPSTSRQSQFSRQIKELELAVGAKLFERNGKSLKPTAFGLQLARMSRTFFSAVADLASQETEKPGQLHVGGGEGMLRWVMVPCIGALRDLDPPIHCKVRNLRSADIIRELELGGIDVGLVRKSAITENLMWERVGTFEFTLVVPRRLLRTRSGDEVFVGRPLPYAELSGEGQLATAAREISKRAGIRLNRVVQAETLSLLLASVEHEDAAAFLPIPAIAGLPEDRFAQVDLENIENLSREMVLAWLPDAADQKPNIKRATRILARRLQQTMADFSRGIDRPGI